LNNVRPLFINAIAAVAKAMNAPAVLFSAFPYSHKFIGIIILFLIIYRFAFAALLKRARMPAAFHIRLFFFRSRFRPYQIILLFVV